MDNPVQLFFNIVTLTIIVFGAHLLFLRALNRQTYLPLAICLLAIGVVICQPSIAFLLPELRDEFLIFSLPALLLIAPMFWFYVVGLTAESAWHVRQVNPVHIVPAVIGLLVSLVAVFMPADIKYALLMEGDDAILKTLLPTLRYTVVTLLITTLLLVIFWVLQSGWYFDQVVRRLAAYRRQLKDLFATTDAKEIRWLSWLLLAVGVVWSATAINILLDNLFYSTEISANLAAIVTLLMVWSIALWGLRQKPGLEELYDSKEEINDVLDTAQTASGKYQKSALDQAHAEKIAAKIEAAMQQDKLYLDASLSLQKLAKHISTSPNYISQTLNESLGMNFFDYVNKHRVQAAQQLLRETDDTVLDIAMNVGFNAKSSFYTAFKKEVFQTPSQYRKSAD
ncbi:helix-turn-helix domain-containing protein [Thalassotalea euphylliae]|uniref:helix-turn-helix domain-containing protein n=1 Tax=Thalassotalea euphylliae TaxID=1655234 RepID=UPI00363BE053